MQISGSWLQRWTRAHTKRVVSACSARQLKKKRKRPISKHFLQSKREIVSSIWLQETIRMLLHVVDWSAGLKRGVVWRVLLKTLGLIKVSFHELEKHFKGQYSCKKVGGGGQGKQRHVISVHRRTGETSLTSDDKIM